MKPMVVCMGLALVLLITPRVAHAQGCSSIGSSIAYAPGSSPLDQTMKDAFNRCQQVSQYDSCDSIAEQLAKTVADNVATAATQVVGTVSGGPSCFAEAKGKAESSVGQAYASALNQGGCKSGTSVSTATTKAATDAVVRAVSDCTAVLNQGTGGTATCQQSNIASGGAGAMGAYFSKCEPAAPAPAAVNPFLTPTAAAAAAAAAEKKVATDYTALPQPVRYEELQREVMMSLKPDLFEGLRFDITKPLNQNFALSHSVFMGNQDVPTAGAQVVKMAIGTYEFGANLVTNKGNLLLGRINSDGRLTGRIKYDLTDWAAAKAQFQMAQEKGMSQAMFDCDLKGKDWNGQLKYGTSNFYGANYFQSITPQIAVGGEVFYLAEQRRSGFGLAARRQADKSVATLQIANTGLISLSYVQKVSEKVSLASDFMYNVNSREATATFGYDYILRQCRLRGRIDSDGKIAAFLEERVNVGVNFILSAEIDHTKNDYKFGFGMAIGE
ncbi:hypothetical protein N2152v2_002015 [Parachlorella kessleri]